MPPASQDKTEHQMVNHLEKHRLLTEKYNLLFVMQKFCETIKESPFDFMPVTFYVDIRNPNKDTAIMQSLQPFS